MTPLGLTTLWGLLALGGSSYVQDPPPSGIGPEPAALRASADSTVAPEDVPFVAQEPLLCGGAAAVMVERYWGRRGVYADAYAHLVLEEAGGIRAVDLLSSMEDRGLDVHVSTGSPDAAFSALRRGIPPILLLAGGDPALHYVVLVGVEADRVWIHDPNFGPSRSLSRERLMERWAGSGHLALLATPARSRGESDEDAGPSDAPPEPTRASSPFLDSAMTSLRAGDHGQARARARRILEEEPGAADLARRLLATSFYLDGRPLDALAAWNALSEPDIDLVEIRGAQHVRHHVLESDLGVETGTLLTPRDLRLARRRLAAIPAVETSRMGYAPLPDGTAEVRAFVTESPRWPSPLAVMGEAVSAAVDEAVSLELGPFLPTGDRWTVGGAWRASQELVHGAFTTGSRQLPGVVGVSVEWRRERHAADDAVRTEARTRGTLRLDRWVSPALRVGGGGAVERWNAGAPGQEAGTESRRLGSVRADALWSPVAGLDVTASGEGWWGSGTAFRRGSLELRLDRDVGRRWGIRTLLAAGAVSEEAPRTVWPGVGTGEIREGLLRGHPLQVDGRIAGAGLGKSVLHGTLEVRRFRSLGPLRAGVAVFLDAATVWPGDGASPSSTLFDPGAGLFVDTGLREIRVDVARGDDSWVLSGRVSLSGQR